MLPPSASELAIQYGTSNMSSSYDKHRRLYCPSPIATSSTRPAITTLRTSMRRHTRAGSPSGSGRSSDAFFGRSVGIDMMVHYHA